MIRERGLLRRSPRRLMPPARRHSPPPRPVSPEESRRILLARQGLATPPAARSGPRSVARLVHRLGFVQVDSINVVERAHHLILHTRFDAYRPSTLTRLLEHERSLFEHWTHDASVIPLEFHAHWRPRFRRYEQRAEHRAWWKERLGRDPDALLARVLGRIRSEGPARARDFEDERRDAEGGSWWNWHPGKAALEHLWRTGRLAIAGRNGFEKIYDLAERVHPSTRSQAEPTDEEHVDWACRTALDRLGVATPAEIAAFWKSIPLARARAWCRSRIDEGESTFGSLLRFQDPDHVPMGWNSPDPPAPDVHPSRHPEPNDQAGGVLESEDQLLPSTAHPIDAETRSEASGFEPSTAKTPSIPDDVAAMDLDAVDSGSEQLGRQVSTNGLDFGQFRHDSESDDRPGPDAPDRGLKGRDYTRPGRSFRRNPSTPIAVRRLLIEPGIP